MTPTNLYHIQMKETAEEYDCCPVCSICSEQKGFFALWKYEEFLDKWHGLTVQNPKVIEEEQFSMKLHLLYGIFYYL